MAVGTVSKPAVRSVWATTAAAGSLSDPGDAFGAIGWPASAIAPARQYFNWLQNYMFNGVRYQCSRGLPDWDATETFYSIGSVVIGDDGLIRAALQAGPNAQTPGTNSNKAPSTQAAFWGSMQVPIPTAGDASFAVAPTAFVTNAVASEASLRSAAVNNEASVRAAAISNEASVRANGDTNTLVAAETFTNAATAALAPKNSPNLTGTPTAPTAPAGNNSAQLATTAFVSTNIGATVAAMLSGTVVVTTSSTAVLAVAGLIPGASYKMEVSGEFTNTAGDIASCNFVPNTGSITALGLCLSQTFAGNTPVFCYNYNAASGGVIIIGGSGLSTAVLRGTFSMPAGATSGTFEMATAGGTLTWQPGANITLTRIK